MQGNFDGKIFKEITFNAGGDDVGHVYKGFYFTAREEFGKKAVASLSIALLKSYADIAKKSGFIATRTVRF